MLINDTSILNCFKTSPKETLKARHIAELLGVRSKDKGKLKGKLRQMTETGALRETPGKRYALGTASAKSQPQRGNGAAKAAPAGKPTSGERIQGRLVVNPKGFAFFQLDQGGDDLFVHRLNRGDALHHDRVEISVKKGPRGKEAVVERVVERTQETLTGRLFRDGKRWLLEPDDGRLLGPYRVVQVSEEPERNQIWLAEFTRFPGEKGPGEVALLQPLGEEGSREVEEARILIRERVQEDFPDEVTDEAAAAPGVIGAKERARRRDLRHLPFISIDPASAKDHDDAVFVEKMTGGYRVLVAIADVAHFVPKGSALDEEALNRSFSIYLPDRSIPMLPERLSGDLASLIPGKDRLCMGVEVELGSRGAVKRILPFEGILRSKAKLTYEAVARTLGFTEQGAKERKAEALKPQLLVLEEVAKLLRAARMRAGALTFDLPAPRITFNDDGEPESVVRSSADPGVSKAYHLVEEMMLLANTSVARLLTEAKRPLLYRVHGVPDSAKLERFIEMARALGYRCELEDLQEPAKLRALLKRIDSREDHREVLSGLLLRAMQQACYATTNVGHFGLANPCYLHFTSPIRRYPDLTVHRELKRLINGQPPETTAELLGVAGVQSSRQERRAISVERDVVDVYRCIVLKDHLGERFMARVSGLEEHSVYVTLDTPFAEMTLPVERLPKDEYRLSKTGAELLGQRSGLRFRLGQRLEVTLEEVDLRQRRALGRPTAVVEASERESQMPAPAAAPKASHVAAAQDARQPNRPAPGGSGQHTGQDSGDAPRRSRSARRRDALRRRRASEPAPALQGTLQAAASGAIVGDRSAAYGHTAPLAVSPATTLTRPHGRSAAAEASGPPSTGRARAAVSAAPKATSGPEAGARGSAGRDTRRARPESAPEGGGRQPRRERKSVSLGGGGLIGMRARNADARRSEAPQPAPAASIPPEPTVKAPSTAKAKPKAPKAASKKAPTKRGETPKAATKQPTKRARTTTEDAASPKAAADAARKTGAVKAASKPRASAQRSRTPTKATAQDATLAKATPKTRARAASPDKKAAPSKAVPGQAVPSKQAATKKVPAQQVAAKPAPSAPSAKKAAPKRKTAPRKPATAQTKSAPERSPAAAKRRAVATKGGASRASGEVSAPTETQPKAAPRKKAPRKRSAP